jgi:DNA-binding response OmpR family regulator
MIHSTIERGILGAMLGRLGEVLCFDELFEAGWPDGSESATANALRVQITRMNRRVGPLGLSVCGVRAVGYVLDEVRFAPLQPPTN